MTILLLGITVIFKWVKLYCWTRYRLVMPANTRNLVMDFPCMLDTRHFSHGNNFEKAAMPPGPNTSYPFELSRRIVDFSNHVELETLLPQSRFSYSAYRSAAAKFLTLYVVANGNVLTMSSKSIVYKNAFI